VVIDECEVPKALQSTHWQRITDLESYDQEFERIVSAIYGHTKRPPLGEPPAYTRLEMHRIPSLTETDTIVFKTICELSVEQGHPFINTGDIVGRLQELDITEEKMYESLDILAERYFIENGRTFGSRGIDSFNITSHGFEQYAAAFLDNFEGSVRRVILAIVNHDLDSNDELADHLSEDMVLINYMLDILESRGYIKLIRTAGGNISVLQITTSGKRFARGI
jgi:hypothetical protein